MAYNQLDFRKRCQIVHINAFTAEILDDLLTAYEKLRDRTYTLLNQIRLSLGLDNPEIVKKLYDSFPEEKLDKLCTK